MQQSEGAFHPSRVLSDRYQVIVFIGGGEHTEVYKVNDLVSGQVLAMKVLREDAPKEAELRLSREFYHLSRFDHPGIVRAIDYGTTQERRPYFTMEFFDGVPLNAYFSKGYTPELEQVTVQILAALDSIHAQGLIHCDLKPPHVLVTDHDGGPKTKLLDFGFAEQMSLAHSVEPRGTLGYVAPEVFKGTEADARADLYSLGMVLYETVTGKGPLTEKDLRAWLRRQYYSDFEPARVHAPGIPEKFEAFLMSLLNRDPDRRPRSASAAIEALTGSASSTAVGGSVKYLMAPSFVGRADTLVQLSSLLTGTAQGKSAVVCVSGERGVGKTRLMSEFKFMAQLEGATIFAFEPASLGARPQSLIESLLGYLRVYARTDLPASEEASLSSISEEGKFRLFELVTQRLRELAASHRVEHSLVLIIDDFELFDPTSLEFLRYLVFSLGKDRISVFVCGLKERRFLDLVAELERTGFLTHITLPGMNQIEVRQLATSLLGEAGRSDELTAWLMQTTGGNPLFIIETVHALIESKVLVMRNGRWQLQSDELVAYRPPETVTDVVRRRLKNLTEEELEILEVGAAAGAPFSLEFLRAVLPYDEKVLFNVLGRLKGLGLLRTFAGEGMASFILSSKILEAVVTDRLPIEQRRENHRRVALALELLYPEKQDKLIFDLAYHYTQAGIADRAYAYSVRAGRRAREFQLSEQALGFYETALSLSPKTAPARERVELIQTVGELREITGRYAEAIDIYTQGMGIIVADKELSRQKELLARFLRKLGLVYQRQGRNDEALNYFSQALLMQPDKTGADYVRILADLGWSYCSLEQFDRAEDLLTQALQATEKLKTQDQESFNQLSGRTLYYFSVLAWSRSDFVLALQLAERSLGIYEAVRDGYNVGKVSQFIATLWWRRGELDKAREYYQRYLPAQRKSGDVYFLLRTLQGLGIISQDEGEWDKAYDYFEEALRLAERMGDSAAIAYLNSNLGSVSDERGDWKEAERHFSRAMEGQVQELAGSGADRATVLANMARLKARTGDLDEAERLLAEASRLAEQAKNPDVSFYVADCRIQLALLSEKLDAARRSIVVAFGLARQEKDWRKRASLFTQAAQLRLAAGDYGRALTDACRALVLLGEYPSSKEYAVALRFSGLAKCFTDKCERGTQEIRRSIELLKGLGSKYELGLSLLASGQALTKQSRGEQTVDLKMPVSFRPVPESELSEALANLRHAEEIFRSLGAQFDLQRAEELTEVLTQVAATMQLKARERGEYLKVFYRLSELMSMGLDKDDFCDRVLDLIVEVTKAERGVLFLYQGTKLVPAAARGVDHATVDDAMSVSQSVLRKVKRRGDIVFSADAFSDPRFSHANSVMLNKIRSLLCAPLKVENRVVGTIYLDSRITAHLFLEEDKNLLMSVANLLAATIDKSLAFQRLQEEMSAMREDILVDAATGYFLGRSKAIRDVYQIIDRIAPTDCTVLLTGETGTGKGVLARLIHSKSGRKDREFVTINCGTMPETLLESELFGHVRGAFTSAVKDKPGLFETAEGGTAFLDEVTNTTLSTQGKLLQVLEERTVRRVGDTETRHVDVRLICATNKDLATEVAEGRFRQDLYYRMNVVSIKVPPLRERTTDIPHLANFFVKRYARQLNKPVVGFDESVMKAFLNYQWLGNVRELQNVIERAVIMTQRRRIALEDLGSAFSATDTETEPGPGHKRRAFDRDQVIAALKETDGNVTKAAELLATHRRQLQRLIKRYRIDRSIVLDN
ncbi:MAG: sigma 54-interacting transcriptional regulator [candidate division WOR-3 bacterium]